MNLQERLEQVLIEAMNLVKDKTAANFGKAQAMEDKTVNQYGTLPPNPASSALTVIDLENQEVILQHLYKYFPQVEISVEERTDNPTEVQAKFYQNDGKSDILVQLDPIDGTYCYKNGIRPDYGIIGSVVERISPQEGMFISGLRYYPSLDFFLLANKEGITKIDSRQKTKLRKENTSKPLQFWT